MLLELWARTAGMTGKPNASRRARRRKERIGIGIPPREYGSTPPQDAVLPPFSIKTPWGDTCGLTTAGLDAPEGDLSPEFRGLPRPWIHRKMNNLSRRRGGPML